MQDAGGMAMIERLLSAGLGSAIDDILGRFFTDKDKAAEAAQELRLALLNHERTAYEVARDTIVSEAKSEHWITSAWRPITMLTFTAIVANNYILAPYIDLLFNVDTTLEPPEQLWELIKIGVGGYIVSRGAEKVAREVKQR